MGTIAWLQLRQVLGEKKIFLIALFLALPALLSLAYSPPAVLAGESEKTISAAIFLFLLYPQTTCLLLALLYGSSILNTEVEGKTLTYLFSRPIAKWKVFTAKYAAIAGCLVVPTLGSFLVSWAIVGAPGGARFLLGFALSITGAIAIYTAVFSVIAVFFRKRPMIVGLIYGIIEFILSFIPALVSTMTATYFLRSIVARVLDLELPTDLLRLVGAASLATSVLALAALIAAAVALAGWAITQEEFASADNA